MRADKYWDEGYTPYSNTFDFSPQWLFKYNDKLSIGSSIETFYLMWK